MQRIACAPRHAGRSPCFPSYRSWPASSDKKDACFCVTTSKHEQLGAVFRLFLVSVLLLRVLFYEHQVVALLTNRNRNSNGASEHEHEHRIAPRASNVAPKNTVRRKRTGVRRGFGSCAGANCDGSQPNRPLPTPFFVSRENGSCRTVDRFKNADLQGERRQQLDKLSTQILLHLLRTQRLLLFTFVKEQQSSVIFYLCYYLLVLLLSRFQQQLYPG